MIRGPLHNVLMQHAPRVARSPLARTAHGSADQAIAGLYEVEFRALLPDGNTRWLGERGRVLQGRQGQPTRIVGIVQDISERKATEEALLVQALHDPLTGLPNRILLRERVDQVVTRRRDGKVSVFMVLDLDGFKEINDVHGHPLGDIVLREIANRWRSVLRRGETLARLGGNEFAVLADRLDSGDVALRIGDRLVQRLGHSVKVAGHSLRVGVSVGIALYPEHGDDFDTLVTNADRAMYSAKRSGGGCVVVPPADGRVTRPSA